MSFAFEIKTVGDMYGIFKCPQEWRVDETGCVFHRVYYVYDGSAVYEDDSRQFELKKDKLYIFPSNRPYRIYNNSDNTIRCLWFHIIISPIILNSVISYSIEEKSIAYHIVKSLELTVCEHSKYESKKILLLQLLHSLLYTISLKERFITQNDTRLNMVIEFIHKHYNQNITNEGLADLLGYDTRYFIRLFKKTFGTSPQKYVLNYRLSKAVGYIWDKTPIWEVSAKVGYTNTKAFCRAFKNIKGVPPSEYKKSYYLQP